MCSFKFGFDLPVENEVSSFSNNNDESQHIDDSRETSNRHSDNDSKDGKMPLSLINMNTFLSTMKGQPQSWNYSEIILQKGIGTKESIHIMSSYKSLKRITHSEQPFYADNDADKEIKHISLMAQQNTDIIPGKYEGGLKVWECSIDLCNYLHEQICEMKSNNLHSLDTSEMVDNDVQIALSSGGYTVELGCGHALPGCLVLKEAMETYRTASECGNESSPVVLFTDYNSFVLRDVTLPNILLNITEKENTNEVLNRLKSVTGLVAGDWMELSSRLCDTSLGTTCTLPEDGRFDLILAAETTYTSSSAKDTALWLYNHLKVGSGVGLVATKRYYFGVGGGSDAFRKASVSHGLKLDLLREYNDGNSNIRDLWRVRL